MKKVIYQTHKVSIVPLEEGITSEETLITPERMPSIIELLEFMAHLPLRDQVYMVCNLLTISGFTQEEIAKHLGVTHQTYRNYLLRIRHDFKEKGLTEF